MSIDFASTAQAARCPVCHVNPDHGCRIRLARGYHQRRLQKAVWRQRDWRPTGAGGRYLCAVCGKVIGKQSTHILTDTDMITCVGCLFDDSRDAHKVCYPQCEIDWHDMYDKPHKHTSCTLAGLRAVIRKGGYHAVTA
jgi:hypothetical protein